jgi:integrase
MKLTDEYVAALTLPAGKSEITVWCEALPGFGVRLRASGAKTWMIQFRPAGSATSKKKYYGSPGLVKVTAARKAAEKDLAHVRLGQDPQAAKVEQRAKASETFGSFVELFLADQKKHLKPRSFEQVSLHMSKHWAPFKSLPIRGIERRDVAAQLTRIAAERGDFAGNRARTSLSSFFSWAIGAGIVDANPVAGSNKTAKVETKRERVLTDAELGDVWNACRDDHYGRIVKLLILTGCRRDEVGGMAKSELDLSGRKWSIAAARTKNNLAHDVPLSDLALNIIGDPGERGVVFGDGLKARSAGDRGFSGWSKAKAALDARINEARAADGRGPMAGWVLHDLRRSAATRMAEKGTSPHVVESLLNHVSGFRAGVAGTYNRASYWNERRQALDLWASHVEALVAGEPSNVVTGQFGREVA